LRRACGTCGRPTRARHRVVHAAVVIGGGVPNPTTGGGALTAYTIVRHALDEGHRVTVFTLIDAQYYDPASLGAASRVEHLRDLGAQVVLLPSDAGAAVDTAPRDIRSRMRRATSPGLRDLFPNVVDAARLRSAVEEAGCDVAFVYHWE